MSNSSASRPIAVGSNGVVNNPPRNPSKRDAKMAAMKKRKRPDEQSSEEIQHELNRHKIERAVFWAAHIGLGLFLGFSALAGLLVRPERYYWESLIWFVPWLVALVPIGVSVFRFRRYGLGQVGIRVITSLLVGLLLFVGFYVIIELGFSDFIFAFFAGNETIGYLNVWREIGSWLAGLGVVGAIIGGILVAIGCIVIIAAKFLRLPVLVIRLGWILTIIAVFFLLPILLIFIGWILTIVAVFFLPPALVIYLIEGLIQDSPPAKIDVLIRTLLVIVMFIMPIGQSIVANSRM